MREHILKGSKLAKEAEGVKKYKSQRRVFSERIILTLSLPPDFVV